MLPQTTRLTLLFICGLLVISSSAQIPTNGLVAYYPLDGNANDASGNGLHGAATAVSGSTNRFGQENAALLFDGVQSFIDCGNPPAFNFQSNFTIAAWVKTTGDQINKYIVAKYNFQVSTYSYGLGTSGSQPYGFVMGAGPGYVDASANINLNDERWHAIALVYDAQSGIRLFANGIAHQLRSAPNFSPFINDVPLMIGRTFSGQHFGGAIDDVRIYDRTLSDGEVAQLGPGATLRITAQPNSYYTSPGTRIPLKVAAIIEATSEPAQVQWFRNNQLVADLTNFTITVSSPIPTQDIYRAKVRVGNLEEWSNEATVTFTNPSDARLLSHYTFDNDTNETVIDETGNYSGTGTNVTYGPGRIGSRSIRFTGINSFARMPYPASPLDLAGTPYTIAFWLKLEPPVASNQQLIWMADTADTVGGYGFVTSSSQLSWTHNSGSDSPLATSAFRPGTNWLHLAMVWNGFTRTIFTNGVPLASLGTTNAIVGERNDDFYLGARNGTSFFLRGSLDDLRIYNYALASDEISQLKENLPTISLSIIVNAGGLALSWPFLDASYSYRVEYADSLDPGAQWNPASGIPQRSADTYSLSQSKPASSRFYRLRRL